MSRLSVLLGALLLLTGCSIPAAESVGIIGGADGPTAIFVTSTLIRPLTLVCYAVLGTAVLAGIVILLLRRTRRK